jgi:hypothetical protein
MSSKLREGLLSASAILDGLSRDEQILVAAGRYDARFPALRSTYVTALCEEMARAILANVLTFRHCPDLHWARSEESWHLVETSETIH